MEASPSPLRQGIVQVQIRDVHDVNVFFFFLPGQEKLAYSVIPSSGIVVYGLD